METTTLQKNDLRMGGQVCLDIGGAIYQAIVQDIHQNFLYLTTLGGRGKVPRMHFNQPVYLMHELEEGGLLFVLLRFMQYSAKEKRADIFRVVRSTFRVDPGDAMQTNVCGQCELTIFSIFNRLRMEYNGRVQIYGLSEAGIGLIVPSELPYDTFAECEFDIGGAALKLPARATYGRSSQNGAYHKMSFEFICISKKEKLRIRNYLFTEQARRMREG